MYTCIGTYTYKFTYIYIYIYTYIHIHMHTHITMFISRIKLVHMREHMLINAQLFIIGTKLNSCSLKARTYRIIIHIVV